MTDTIPLPIVTHLPAPLTPLVGRERERAALLNLLRRDGVRLVTLTGAGGVGKTRLALTVAEELAAANSYADGICFVPLAAVTDPDLVLPTIAKALGLQEIANLSLEDRLPGLLHNRRHLVVLDNFEQVIAAASIVPWLLSVAPGIQILVTSRELLRVSGEYDLPVLPLASPDPIRIVPIAELATTPAVQLFVARAQAAVGGFALTADNASAVAAICHRLDGLPLAIELAATRVRLFSPPALLERLGRRLPLLTGGARDLPARQRTMRDAIVWSYDLLPAEEQALFRRLSIFVGGFTLEAAEYVGERAGGREGALSALDGIASLLDKSLVRQAPGGKGTARFRFVLLETIREYGLEQLEACGEATALGEAHAAYYLAQAERAATTLTIAGSEHWHEMLVPEVANFGAAQTFLAGQGAIASAMRLVIALEQLWWILGDTIRVRQALEAYLATAEGVAPSVRARALIVAARLQAAGGNCPGGLSLIQQALALARASGDAASEAAAVEVLGMINLYVGELTEARHHLEDAVARYRELELRYLLGHALCQLAWVGDFGTFDRPGNADDLRRSTAYCEEALALFREIDQPLSIAKALFGLGYLAYRQRDYPRAAAVLGEAIALHWKHHDLWELVEPLEDLADVLALTGHAAAAVRLYGAVEALRDRIGKPIPPAFEAEYEREVMISRDALGEDVFAAELAAGRTLPLEKAIAEALAITVSPPAPPRDSTRALNGAAAAAAMLDSLGLSPRERDVLRLLCEGASNQRIADTLFISVPTVKTHVANVRGKLGVETRAAAVTFAHRHGLFSSLSS